MTAPFETFLPLYFVYGGDHRKGSGFTAMDRLVQKFNRRARATSDLYVVLTLLITIIIVGTIGFKWLEGWSLIEALYTTVITITTVDYGDFSPSIPEGRPFAIFFAATAIAIKHEQRRVEYRRWERKMKKIEDLDNHIYKLAASQ